MIQTDLMGVLVQCPTKLDAQWNPIEWGYGLVRGAYARRAGNSTYVEVIVQTLDHVVGKAPHNTHGRCWAATSAHGTSSTAGC